MDERKVAVWLPERVWGRLASAADARGETVADVLVDAVNRVIRPTERRERIVLMATAGCTDREIADETGETVSYIAGVRRDADIPANRDRTSERRKGTA